MTETPFKPDSTVYPVSKMINSSAHVGIVLSVLADYYRLMQTQVQVFFHENRCLRTQVQVLSYENRTLKESEDDLKRRLNNAKEEIECLKQIATPYSSDGRSVEDHLNDDLDE